MTSRLDGEIRVLELVAPGRTQFAWRPVPPSGPLLRTEAVGLCGTDARIFEGRIPASMPRILGHEIIGRLERWAPEDELVITAIGEANPSADPVVLAPAVVCDACEACLSEERCRERVHYGLDMPCGGLNGGMSPLLSLAPRSRLFAVAGMPLSRLVFAEPMACVVSALRRAGLDDGGAQGVEAAVLGFGPLGICASTALTAVGARPTIVEPDRERRELAGELGFAVDPVRRPGGVGVALECAGDPRAFVQGLGMLGRGGMLVEVGAYGTEGTVPIEPARVCDQNLRIVGSSETGYADFERALRIVADSEVDLGRAIADSVSFHSIDDGGRLFGRRHRGKTMVVFDG